MDEMRKAERRRSEHKKHKVPDKQLWEMEGDKSLLLVRLSVKIRRQLLFFWRFSLLFWPLLTRLVLQTNVAEAELASEHSRAHTALNSAAAAWEHQARPAEISRPMGGSLDVSAEGERVLTQTFSLKSDHFLRRPE